MNDAHGDALRSFAGIPPDEVEALIPPLVMSAASQGVDLAIPPHAMEVFQRFLEKARIFDGDGPTLVQHKIDAYYRRHPIRPELLLILEHALRSSAASSGLSVSRALDDVIGTKRRVAPLTSARPAGTTPAGPLARFSMKGA